VDGEFQVSGSVGVLNDAVLGGGTNSTAVSGVGLQGSGVAGLSEGIFGIGSSGVSGAAGNAAGVGVQARNVEHGTALYVWGKTRMATRSGRATVVAGRSSVDIDLRSKGGLSGTPLCFANLMSDRPGVFVRTFRPTYPVTGKARIYLNRTVGANTYVAWFVLS
jgi:hypothetical protein